MGVLNLTPDSFSDGGAFMENDAAIAQFEQLIVDGADILDIGAESTRPGATPLTHAQEWARLQPLLAQVMQHPSRSNITISIDTRHAQTAANALAIGAEMINDVGGLRDADMRAVLAASTCDIVVMHALTIPSDKAVVWPPGTNPLTEVLAWKLEVAALAATASIAPERLIFDPGIGFGKTPEQSLALILHAAEIIGQGGRWLYGHSRKSFLTLFSDVPATERDALTLAFSAQLAFAEVDYLRVHAVAKHRALLERICT
jgi:dihydropteroate synthase